MIGYLSDLKREFHGYSGRTFAKDLFAGLTVAAVALPLALAFGVGSGADAVAGLITAIVAGFVIGALSGAYYQISGPTGAMAAVLVSIVSKYHMQGVFIATLIAGVLLILAGVFRLGKLTAFIPAPVITGFTSGIAVIIALGQIDNFFGVTSSGDTVLGKLMSYGTTGFSPDFTAVGVGLFVVLFMVLFPRKWNAVVPASLVAIVLATVLSAVLGLSVETVGEIPNTLLPENRLSFSGIRPGDLPGLMGPAVSIALLGMIESLMCGSSAGRMTGVRLKSDRELIAQGVGNVLIPFFGGIPATAAIARTSVAVKSGAKTRLAGIIHAATLLLSLLLLGPVMSRIPLSALAGVLIMTAWRMNEWEAIRYIFRRRFKGAILKFLATMAATIVFDLTAAILIGMTLALILLIKRLSGLEINCERVDAGRIGKTSEELPVFCQNACVVYISGPLVFASARSVEEIPEKVPEGCRTVFLSMRGVSHMDITGVQALGDVIRAFREENVDVTICGLPDASMQMIRRSGIFELVGEGGFYGSVDRALLGRKPA